MTRTDDGGLVAELRACAERWRGHSMAETFTLAADEIAGLRAALVDARQDLAQARREIWQLVRSSGRERP